MWPFRKKVSENDVLDAITETPESVEDIVCKVQNRLGLRTPPMQEVKQYLRSLREQREIDYEMSPWRTLPGTVIQNSKPLYFRTEAYHH